MNPVLLVLPRVIVGALFVAVGAGAWDTWWHLRIGRETFWSPPHLLLYVAVVTAIGVGLYGWARSRDRAWRVVAVVLMAIPLSAPFDELWHRVFGVESLLSPLVIWSPPHLVLIGSLIASFAMLLPLLARDPDPHAARFFGSLAFGATLWLAFLVLDPLQPLGLWRLLGFAGAGVIAASVLGLVVVAHRWLPGAAGGTASVLALAALIAIGWGENVAEGLVVPPHPHPPLWLSVFSLLALALVVDAVRGRPRLRGAFAGFVYSAIFYLPAPWFIEPEFRYPLADAWTAIAASLIGGALVGAAEARVKTPEGASRVASGAPATMSSRRGTEEDPACGS